MDCPACGFDNIEGSDVCDRCQTSLTNTQVKWSQVESGERAITDTIAKAGMRPSILVGPDTPSSQAIALMREMHRGCALVVDGQKLVGLLTRRDVLHRLAKPNLNLNEIPVCRAMSVPPETLQETDTIGYALNKMAMGNYRHVPVQCEDGTFGVFSCRDALQYFF